MMHTPDMDPGQEYVALSDDQVRLVLWRCGSAERYHLYREDVSRGVDELVGIYSNPGIALADAQRLHVR